MGNKKRGKNAVDNTNEERMSKFRKIKNPNNNTVAAVENVEQEPLIQDFAAELLKETRCTNQLLTHISKQLDVIVGELLNEEKMERSYENVEEGGDNQLI